MHALRCVHSTLTQLAPNCRPKALDRASLAAAVKANEGARAFEPPPALPLPALLQSNFLLPMSLPTNVRQYADVPSPKQAHAGSARWVAGCWCQSDVQN